MSDDPVFPEEPTSRGDAIAAEVRKWYEANREDWWDRTWNIPVSHADNFMLGLINEVNRIQAIAAKQQRAKMWEKLLEQEPKPVSKTKKPTSRKKPLKPKITKNKD